MTIQKAVITAAAPNQRTLPLQTLVDRDGHQKSVLSIIVEEARRAGINQICVVVGPEDTAAFERAVEGSQLTFVTQPEPLGYGDAIYRAKDFVAGEPFLHMIGDHVYVDKDGTSCAQMLVEAAAAHDCAVSSVQPTRENLLPYFGAIGGTRVKGTKNLYSVERVLEKPTPTEAEQKLLVPGLRAGHYLCFFGMHVLTPGVMEILGEKLAAGQTGIALSPVLNELAKREKYLAFEAPGRRYPLDQRYGLLTAQLALALNGRDREEVLAGLCELLAQRDTSAPAVTA